MLLPPVLFDCPLPSPSHCPLMSSVETHVQCSPAGPPIQNQGVGDASPPFQPPFPPEVPPVSKPSFSRSGGGPVCQLASSSLKELRFSSLITLPLPRALRQMVCLTARNFSSCARQRETGRWHRRLLFSQIPPFASPGALSRTVEAVRGRVWGLGGVCALVPRGPLAEPLLWVTKHYQFLESPNGGPGVLCWTPNRG